MRNIACCQSRRQNETPLLSGSLKNTSDEMLFLELARRGYDLEDIMAKDTNTRIEDNLGKRVFRKLLEEAKLMVPGNKAKAAYHMLKHMNLSSHENNPDLFSHIPDRQLAELLGIPGGKSTVWGQRERLIQERWGVENVVNNVDASKVKIIGKGSESIYLYYFPTYQLFNKLHLEVSYFPCNIGKTLGDVKDRVSKQIGQQLPERPKIALIIKTDDCEALVLSQVYLDS